MKIEDPLRKDEGGRMKDEKQARRFVPDVSSFILHPSSFRPKRRLWRDKFRESLRGIKLGIRGHSSFFVHFFFAALVLATAIVLRCEALEWCLLLGCIGLVITAELFNSAVEAIYHGLDDSTRPRVRHCLDIAAGAVLLASITAALIGAIVFVPKLAAMLVHLID
jgi:diacylglycerol kinase